MRKLEEQKCYKMKTKALYCGTVASPALSTMDEEDLPYILAQKELRQGTPHEACLPSPHHRN